MTRCRFTVFCLDVSFTLEFVCYVMPISSNIISAPVTVDKTIEKKVDHTKNSSPLQNKKLTFNVRGKSATTNAEREREGNQFLTIAPALPILPGAPVPPKLTKSSTSANFNVEDAEVGGCDAVTLQQAGEGRAVVATRTSTEREKNPDRICLDRRGLTTFPNIIGETRLRLLSLQHNLIVKIEGENFLQLTKLVFLDLYDNQIERVSNLDHLENLRVLLIGKNRIKKIEGLKQLEKLEVLDLHGNQIVQISGLGELTSLKVLNLAGNNIKTIGCNDFQGLTSLKELNLRRNKIKKLLGFGETTQLQKLYLSNNDIQKIEDIGSLAKALQLREVTIDGNPVTLNADCVSFLVSYLPNLQILSTMQVNEQVRRAAMAWRTTKEQSNSAFLDLSTQVCVNVRREEVISNAKTNWELLRSQTKCFASNASKTNNIKSDHVRGLQLQSSNKFDAGRTKGLDKSKSKGFGSLTSINEHVEAKKMSFKKRSNSSDNVFRTACPDKVNALDFKLPPILVPIINNLTSGKVNDNGRIDNKTNLTTIDGVETTTDSDPDSSESHESLKSGLRNHLMKPNGRASSMDFDKTNGISKRYNNVLKGNSTRNLEKDIQSPGGNLFIRTPKFNSQDSTINGNGRQSPGRRSLVRNARPFYSHDNQSDYTTKQMVHRPSLYSSSSKTSSVESCKSVLSDSSSSSVPRIILDKSLDLDNDKSRVKSAQIKKVVHYKSNRAATARAKHRAMPSASPPPQPSPPKEREQGGDYLVEIAGRCLNVYGQAALRFIDRPWDVAKAHEVNIVKFNYVQFNGIAMILNRLKNRFPNAEHFIFKETNISHLGQINALAEVQGLTSIQIDAEGNPIISKDWKVYAVFRLAHWGLKVINNKEITDEDIEIANQEYSGLTDIVMWSLPESLLQPLLQRLHLEKVQKQTGEQITAKQFLFKSDPALRNVVAKEALQWRRGNVTQEDLIWRHKGKVHLSNLIDVTVDAIQKLQILEREWPSILFELLCDTLLDYSEMNSYMKRCSAMLESDK
ncbi:leucine-rich repeat-containing protein 49 isoform X2 [Cephus cinctus]|uniref:Dynein axonemal assembly factor 1 homolog n=1 Tax=Cephus cinctus TaxID=211228 RepID=A0AAJ7W0E8_CEPCN|nr:leucine-rich repeat-containing protein 49 isoform X2 [Cephus cinctus]